MKKNLQNLTLLSMTVGLVACNSGSGGGSKSKSIDPVKETVTVEPVQKDFQYSKVRQYPLKSDFSNFTEFKQHFNEYTVTFKSLAGDLSGASVVCLKSDRKEVTQGDFDGPKAKVDLKLESSDPVSVDFRCDIIDREVTLETVKVNIKKSFLVTGTQNIYAMGVGGTAKIESLVLDEGAILTTDGKDVSIAMNEFISFKGTIATYTAEKVLNTKTPDNEPGKSGGLIDIVTGTARGEVKFEFRGLKGGMQTKTQPVQTNLTPADKNLNGKDQSLCKENLGNGRKGNLGQPGLKGVQGIFGGDTGRLLFKSSEENSLKMDLKYYPGEGGNGGVGGQGGVGGPGGKGGTIIRTRPGAGPGMNISFQKCKLGGIGDEGPVGEAGDPGLSGKTLPSSIKMQKEDFVQEITENWKNYNS